MSVTSPADLVLSVAAASVQAVGSERLVVTLDGRNHEAVEEVPGPVGTRLHRIQAPAGGLKVAYFAEVDGRAEPVPVEPFDPVVFGRPSRYCESDRLGAVARDLFGGRTGSDLVGAVLDWTLGNITYAPGSSGPTDGAVDTWLRREGVCRDTAHLVVAFLRALGQPARVVSVYAPGLVPMDFHLVTEVLLDGAWYVVDGTGMSTRPDLVRIATGRDAADTAFLTVTSGNCRLDTIVVTAYAADGLSPDDGRTPVQLG